jgi:hypothetical protein
VRTERLVLLVTPQFKAHLAQESERNGVSVAEFVRSRFERASNSEEAEMAALVHELQGSVAAARLALAEGIAEAQSALLQVRSGRALREAQGLAL